MIHDLKRCLAIKDSGVPWLAEVSKHWEVLPNCSLFVGVKDREHINEQMLSETIAPGGIRPVTLLTNTSQKD
jgi:hypothetical protein